MQKVSDYIAKFLEEKEIRYVFGIIGAGNAHVFDSISQRNYTKIICMHHEQAAVMAMIGYFRITGKISAALLTTGAGATNGVTGVVSAWMDSIPGIIIAGNENSKFTHPDNPLRIWGVQGYDSVAMVEKVTKFSARLMDPNLIRDYLNDAYNISLSLKPGPVWLEIPLNIQASLIDIDEKNNLTALTSSESTILELNPKIEQIKQLIKSSKRPLLWLGHGIRLAGAQEILKALVEKLKIPVLVSWAGADLIASDNEFNFGSAGVYGQRSANFVLQNCDLLITIGCRLSILQTGYDLSEFIREAKLVVNDIDHIEATKHGDKVDIAVVCDCKIFIDAMLKNIDFNSEDVNAWLSYCKKMKINYPRVGFEHQDKNGFINSYKFMDELSKHLAINEIITTDMGTALLSGHQVLTLNGLQRLFTSTGLGEMGFGLPSAIGASFAANKGEVICLNCDGGMMLNLQELQTIVHHKLPIKIFIFNNDGYLMIKHTQKALFRGRYSGTNTETGISCPDYSKIATAFGLPYYSIKTWDDFAKNIPLIQSTNQACICEVFMDPEQLLVPKLSLEVKADTNEIVSPPLEDLSPLLSYQELKENMLIGVHSKSLAIRT